MENKLVSLILKVGMAVLFILGLFLIWNNISLAPGSDEDLELTDQAFFVIEHPMPKDEDGKRQEPVQEVLYDYVLDNKAKLVFDLSNNTVYDYAAFVESKGEEKNKIGEIGDGILKIPGEEDRIVENAALINGNEVLSYEDLAVEEFIAFNEAALVPDSLSVEEGAAILDSVSMQMYADMGIEKDEDKTIVTVNKLVTKNREFQAATEKSITYTKWLMIFAFIAIFAFTLINVVKEPKRFVRSLIGMVALAAIAFICYKIAPEAGTGKMLETSNYTDESFHYTGAGILITATLIVISIALILFQGTISLTRFFSK